MRLIANRYQLLAPIGQGGMGIVYHAVDRLRSEHVALKSISALTSKVEPLRDSPSAQAIECMVTETQSLVSLPLSTALTAPPVHVGSPGHRKALRMALTQEFRTLASLRHPNIITVLDYGFDLEKMPFFTMELLSEARPLLTAAKHLPAADRVMLLIQVAQALLYLHRHGVLHRDLKPANILVISSPTGLQAKVLDFGLAVVKSQSDKSVGGVAGTMHYMAPEMLVGCPPTEGADLYSFGITAFELLTGRLPFDSSHTGKLMAAILDVPPDLSALDAADPLRELIAQLLAKDPARRPRDASALCAQLARSAGLDAPLEARSIRESLLQAAAFVARDSELETLQSALDDMMATRGSGWLIGGESGVGKSRLLDEVRTQALILGAQVLRGQADKLSGAPYHAIREILRALCLQVGVNDAEASCLLPLLPDLPALLQRPVEELPPLDAKGTQERLLRTIEAAIVRISQPTVILLEDIQWAGLEVILTLSRLMRRMARLPIVLIASYRDDEAPWVPSALPAMELLKLHRFDRDSVADLSASMLGPVGRQPELVELLLRETEGNAFFMVEVLRSLAEERGMLSEVGRGKLPKKVFVGGMRAVVERRLNRVPASAHKLLHLAAAAGRELDLAVLRSVEPTLEPWLEECASVAVIEVSESRWRFSHDKLRDCLLEKLSSEERSALHRQLAELIERTYRENERDPSVLAYHYGQAGLSQTAARYSLQAGEIALREGVLEKSLVCFDDALRWLEMSPPDVLLTARALRMAGLARRWLGRIAESLASFKGSWAAFGIKPPLGQPALNRRSLGSLDRQVDAALTAALSQGSGATAVTAEATPLENELLELASSSVASFLWSGLGRWAYFACAVGIKLAERRGLTVKLATFYYNLAYILHPFVIN